MKLVRCRNHVFFAILAVVLACVPASAQQQKADSLRKLLRNKPDDFKLNSQLFESLRKVSADSANRFVDKLLMRAEDRGDSLMTGLAYNCKAAMTVEAGKGLEAVPYYKKSIAMTRHRTDSSGMALQANANRNLGLDLSNLGKYNDAEPYFQLALETYTKLGDSTGMAGTYLLFGQVEKDRGNYEKALKLLFSGLNIAEARNDNKLIGRSMNNIANVYNTQGKYDDAIRFYERSIAYKEKAGLKNEVANTYGNMGVVYYSQKKYDQALFYYYKALPLKLSAGDQKSAASTINNIGLVNKDLKQYDTAEVYFLRALKMRTGINDETGIASSQNALGDLYVAMGRCREAIPYVLNAKSLAEKNGAREILRISYSHLSDAYACTGQHKDAYEYLRLFSELNDTLTKETMLQQSEEMKAKYESDKQEQEIKDLQQKSELEKIAQDERDKQRLSITIGGGLVAFLLIGFLVIRHFDNQKSRSRLILAYNEIETKNKNITDSIRYAQRIQQSILPDKSEFSRLFGDGFVLYKPKDIVSGDFWWISQTAGGQLVIAVADCTGHGVPGAFMSVMGSDLLSQAAKDRNIGNPASALHFLDEGVRHQLRQTGGDDESRDGMDIALALIDREKMQVQFSGALRPLLLVRDGKIVEYAASRFSIGGAFSGEKQFINHAIDVQKGDMLYLFTDGFGDQFGGPAGKKFKTARLKELLVSVASKNPEEQQQLLEKAFNEWKGMLEQVDDICIAGIRC